MLMLLSVVSIAFAQDAGTEETEVVSDATVDTTTETVVEEPVAVAEEPTEEAAPEEAVVEESAERYKILKEMGVNFTKEYFMKRYNLTEGDFELNINH